MAIQDFIPFHRPSIDEEELAAVRGVLSSGWLTTGPVTLQFEREFAESLGCKHALAVNSGTAALQLALDAIGLKPGDEVLLPSFTFTATAEVVTYFGARPVLCDSVAGGFNIDPGDVERRITESTRAIIPVHIAGEPCQMDSLRSTANRHDLRVVEDAAHALPSSHRGARIGTISDLTAFSFYATKAITTGEGGMLTTDNDEYAERASMMRLHGIGRDAWKRYSREGTWSYEVHCAGYKLNLCDVLSALGVAQLRKCHRFWVRRRTIAQLYSERFVRLEELEIPPDGQSSGEHSWHLYILRIKRNSLAITRDEFIEELKELGIGSSVHFIPLHLHPYYARCHGYKMGDFPNAEDACSRCLSLPIFPDLTDEQVERVMDAVEKVVAKNRKQISIAVT
jgi:dTDP-4-amino-4,6-dideoxygalactose transaminase